MKTLYQHSLFTITALLALAGAAFAQVPSTNDTSDGNGNTGMGSTALENLTTGASNTASGFGTLEFNTDGSDNSASGFQALFSNTTGNSNTASGSEALFSSTTGNGNTASGFQALAVNTSGSFNTATGYQALRASDADYNTALGYLALFSNTTGTQNVASGAGALYANTTGSYNAALGQNALLKNTTASNNTATGFSALLSNTSGHYNTASGVDALYSNMTGNDNTASGLKALYSNTTGSNNIAEGFEAGFNLTTGSNNIDIGSKGVAAESDTIRIGTNGTHKVTVIAGIESSKITGSAVYVTTTGRLGVLASSERFKTDIAPMGSDTAKLAQLRPVSFRLKSDGAGTRQYGLIAEQVAKVYPELVIRNQSGRIDGVRYDELAPMLLNEVQQQQTKNSAQDAKIRDLEQQVAKLTALNRATQVALRELQSKDQIVAQR